VSAAPVYLDYAATTPVDPQVAAVMSECLTMQGDFGNPSSAHVYGEAAAARIAHARAQVALLAGADPAEIVFTSGATESDNLAILGCARASAARGRHLVSSRTEHRAVLDAFRQLEREGFQVTWLAPGPGARIEAQALAAALRPDTVLASIMYANNETGVLEDVAALAALCRARGVAFHTDCAQALGKVPLNLHELDVDFASFTAHKLYGPKGIGALYVRAGARAWLKPLTHGGGQERALRPGTLPTHQIAGFGAACALALERMPAERARLAALAERLWRGVERFGGVHLNGAAAPRLPGIVNVSFEGVNGESLVDALGALAVSTGSACNSEHPEPSYVLRALGRDTQLAQSSLRFSLGRYTSDADVDAALAVLGEVLPRLRLLSPQAPDPRQAGKAPGAVLGEAGGPHEDAWVRFELLTEGDIVKDARFKVRSCAHTTDVVAWLAGQLRGRSRKALIPGTPPQWAAERGVPVVKLGRLLVIEDALRACLSHWT
jgi:cysteine desulfurase